MTTAQDIDTAITGLQDATGQVISAAVLSRGPLSPDQANLVEAVIRALYEYLPRPGLSVPTTFDGPRQDAGPVPLP